MSKKEELKISEFFKESFEEQSNTNLGWNNPPDFLFEEAIAQVNGQKTKSNRTKLLILASMAVVALLFAMLFSHMSRLDALESEQLTEEVSNSKVLNKADNKDLSTVATKHESITQESKAATSTKVITAESKVVTSTKTTTAEKNAVSASKVVQAAPPTVAPTRAANSTFNTVSTTIKEEVPKTTNIQTAITQKANKVENLVSVAGKKENLSVKTYETSDIETLSRIEFAILDNVEKVLPQSGDIEFLPAEARAKTKVFAGSKLGFRVGYNLSSLKLETSEANNITNHNGFYSGYGFDFDLQIPLTSRLNLVNIVGFNKYNNESDNTVIHPYKKFKEVLLTSDRASYDITSFVDTPLGRFEEGQTFIVDPRSTVDGEELEHSMTFRQELSVVSLQTGLNYDLLQRDKLTWSAGITGGLNMVVNLKSTMISRYNMGNNIQTEDVIVFNDSNYINTFFGSISLRSDLSYDLGKNFNLSFGLGYLHGLSSITNYSNNSSSTHLQNFTGKIGLYRKF